MNLKKYLIARDTVVTATGAEDSILVPIMSGLGLALSIEAESVSGTSPTFDVTIQQSPDDMSIPDASAVWYTLVAFTQVTTATTELKTVTTPRFERLRANVTVGGTASPTATLTVLAGPN